MCEKEEWLNNVISSGGIAVCARKTHFTMDEF